MFVLFVMRSYLIEVRGLKLRLVNVPVINQQVVSYRGTWVEIDNLVLIYSLMESYLIEVRGLKLKEVVENKGIV